MDSKCPPTWKFVLAVFGPGAARVGRLGTATRKLGGDTVEQGLCRPGEFVSVSGVLDLLAMNERALNPLEFARGHVQPPSQQLLDSL